METSHKIAHSWPFFDFKKVPIGKSDKKISLVRIYMDGPMESKKSSYLLDNILPQKTPVHRTVVFF